MKKVYSIIAAFMVLCFVTVTLCYAEDIMIEKQIKQIVFKNDKNGQPYARVISTQKSTLNGVTYDKDVSLMAFGDVTKELKGMKKGQTLKAVAKEQTFRGSTTYQILKVVK